MASGYERIRQTLLGANTCLQQFAPQAFLLGTFRLRLPSCLAHSANIGAGFAGSGGDPLIQLCILSIIASHLSSLPARAVRFRLETAFTHLPKTCTQKETETSIVKPLATSTPFRIESLVDNSGNIEEEKASFSYSKLTCSLTL